MVWAVSLAGYLVASLSLLDGIMRDGGAAYDFGAYFQAAQRYAAGQPLYATVEINDPGAYRYLPTFAAVLVLATVLPELAATWLYRLVCLLCIRYLVGSWRAVGVSLLFPPVLIELWALNVTLPIAAVDRWAVRGNDASLVPATAVVKYRSALLVPIYGSGGHRLGPVFSSGWR